MTGVTKHHTKTCIRNVYFALAVVFLFNALYHLSMPDDEIAKFHFTSINFNENEIFLAISLLLAHCLSLGYVYLGQLFVCKPLPEI